MKIIFYITGHGYGHAARSCEIIAALAALEPNIKFILKTTVPPEFFASYLGDVSFECQPVTLDVGVVQQDALHPDIYGTIEPLRRLIDRSEELIQTELDSIETPPDLILSDISAIPFRVAKILGIPSVALSNFTWSMIYRDYAELDPFFQQAAERYDSYYRDATLALRYPFGGDFSCFSHVEDLHLVSRISKLESQEILARLNLSAEKPLILLAFGGFSIGGLKQLTSDRYQILSTDPSILKELSVPDLVKVAAAVVGKPGYGMVSECVAAGTPFLYTSRGRFAEYEILCREMRRYIPVRFITNEQLYSGDFLEDLELLLSSHPKLESLKLDGAKQAATLIFTLLNFHI